jgi:hypothetical protein
MRKSTFRSPGVGRIQWARERLPREMRGPVCDDTTIPENGKNTLRFRIHDLLQSLGGAFGRIFTEHTCQFRRAVDVA